MANLLSHALIKSEVTTSLPYCVKTVQSIHALSYKCPPNLRARIQETRLPEVRNAYVCRCLLLVQTTPVVMVSASGLGPGLASGPGLGSDSFLVSGGGVGTELTDVISGITSGGEQSQSQINPIVPGLGPGLAQGPGLGPGLASGSGLGASLFARVAALQDIQSSLTRYVTRSVGNETTSGQPPTHLSLITLVYLVVVVVMLFSHQYRYLFLFL